MAPLLATTYSWIALTTLTPLSSLILTWTIVSIHRKRVHLKTILLLSILYSQLFLQLFNFSHSILNLLKLNSNYGYYLNYVFTTAILYKSLSVLSSHFEEFYKYKYPSNYLLNVNSSLLKYHLLVLFLLSLMGSYLFRNLDFIPLILNPNNNSIGISNESINNSLIVVDGSDSLELILCFLLFHTFIILSSLGFILFKYIALAKSSSSSTSSLDINIIGTNSTSSSTNLFGCDGPSSHHFQVNVQSRTITAVGLVNLMINLALVVCTFSNFWLPSLSLSSWPISNLITWSQVIESIITPIVYSLVQISSTHHSSSNGSGKGSCSRSNCSSGSTNSNGSVTYLPHRHQHHHHHHHHDNNNLHGRAGSEDDDGAAAQIRRQLHHQLRAGGGGGGHHHQLQFHNHRFPVTNGSLCFNNGEFQYFAGSKNSNNSGVSILNNASAYNTFDSSINPGRSTYSKDSLRCASVTTIANDDFEFLSRREEQLLHNNNNNINNNSNSNNIVASHNNNNNINQLGLQTTATTTVSSSAVETQSQSQQPNNLSPTTTNLLQRYYQHLNLNNTNNKSSSSNNNTNLANNNNINSNHSFRQRTINNNNSSSPNLPSSSLSMNDLDLIVDDDEFSSIATNASSTAGLLLLNSKLANHNNVNVNTNNNVVNNKCKYKKHHNYCIKRRFPNSNNANCCNSSNNSGNNSTNKVGSSSSNKSGLTRRVLSLESLHSTVNESHLAYLDTGERVIFFTTDYI